nr:serine/threonine-protein kinase [Streptomyces sp. HNM0574]
MLAGRYRITRRLGRGGMGVVWRATDEVLGREVALKELRTFTDAGGGELDELRTRMQREARAAARVRHSGVVAVHDVAQHEGRPVIVMELVEGPSLDDVLRRSGTLPPEQAASIGARVLDALAAAHRAGVLHRDVKPGNILLEQAPGTSGHGRVVLTDFGIAAVEDPDDGAATRLTGSGELVGSLDYLAPERARGEDPGPASDVWALGATLYAAVEGAAPFRRTSTWSTLTAIVTDPLPEPVRAGRLGPALAELMHKDPRERADASRAAALLTAVAEGAPLPLTSETVRLTRRAPDAPAPGAANSGPAPAPYPAPAAAPPEPPTAPPGAAAYNAAPYSPAPSAPGAPVDPSEARTGRTPSGGKRRRRGLAVAAAALVVLAGGGVTYAVVGGGDDGGGGRAEAGPAGGKQAASPGSSERRQGDGGRGPAGEAEPDRGGNDPERRPEPKPSEEPEDQAERKPERKPAPEPEPSRGPGGGEPAPAPACKPIGGGKHNCEVWRRADSYDAAHRPAGFLKAGVNYFYCQEKQPHRETAGEWTNVWWARTDDDSGNTGVYVSAVYLKGGENDKPVPGLPVCGRG